MLDSSASPTLLMVVEPGSPWLAIAPMIEAHYELILATDINSAKEQLEQEWIHLMLCPQRIGGENANLFIQQVAEQWPEVVTILLGDGIAVDPAIIAAGVMHTITMPWHPETLLMTLSAAAKQFRLQRENGLLNVQLKLSPAESSQPKKSSASRPVQDRNLDELVRDEESPIERVCDHIRSIAPFHVSVLVCGESGTGKELVARALYENSLRWDKPFVVENCAALPDELLESELFGCKKGAFTGAMEDRIGLFERADGGTIFLDEIGEISPAFQVKLLRVLQEGEIRPLGCSEVRKVDLRVIAATNKDLEVEVREGRFREDLYYRLAAMTVLLPPLRDRRQDIPLLANALLQKASQTLGKSAEGFSDEALDCMQQHHWPGNVRELQNEVQQMLVMGREPILGAELLSARVLRTSPEQTHEHLEDTPQITVDGPLKERVETLEASIIRETLIRHRWNKSQAAKELGLSRVGLSNKLERYGLEKEGQESAPKILQ